LVVAGIMLSSGVTIAINPAQWFGDSSDFDEITAEELDAFDLDTLGLELGYSDDESLQFCSANEQAMSNEYVKEYKIPLHVHSHLQLRWILMVWCGLHKQALEKLQNLIR